MHLILLSNADKFISVIQIFKMSKKIYFWIRRQTGWCSEDLDLGEDKVNLYHNFRLSNLKTLCPKSNLLWCAWKFQDQANRERSLALEYVWTAWVAIVIWRSTIPPILCIFTMIAINLVLLTDYITVRPFKKDFLEPIATLQPSHNP